MRNAWHEYYKFIKFFRRALVEQNLTDLGSLFSGFGVAQHEQSPFGKGGSQRRKRAERTQGTTGYFMLPLLYRLYIFGHPLDCLCITFFSLIYFKHNFDLDYIIQFYTLKSI